MVLSMRFTAEKIKIQTQLAFFYYLYTEFPESIPLSQSKNISCLLPTRQKHLKKHQTCHKNKSNLEKQLSNFVTLHNQSKKMCLCSSFKGTIKVDGTKLGHSHTANKSLKMLGLTNVMSIPYL